MVQIGEIENFVNSVDQLPTLPGIAIKLMEAVQADEPDIDEIGAIISTAAFRFKYMTTNILV